MRIDRSRLSSLLQAPRVRLPLLALLLWQLHNGLDGVQARLAGQPVERFQPEAVPAPNTAPRALPLLRRAAADAVENPASGSATDLDQLLIPPPASIRRPAPTPVVAPPAPPTAPVDYATLLRDNLTLQALSARGAVINQHFVAWGEPLPFPVPTENRERWVIPRLQGITPKSLRVTVEDRIVVVPRR
ncbi:hypothetical protein JCM17961_15570 [Endothiovibrio diazotrophicus]